MSSSDQQYPYPYDPQPQPQHWPDGTAGQSALPQEPGGYDQGATQTWQAPTWDTQYQPTIQRDQRQDQHQGHARVYGQPQPDAYGFGQPGVYGAGQPDPYGTSQPQHQEPRYQQPQHQPPGHQQPQQPQHAQQPPRHQEPHHAQQPYQEPPRYQEPQPSQPHHAQQPYQQPQPQPHRPAPAETAYLPPQGASGSLPLPPEVPTAAPAAAPTPVPPATQQPPQPGLDDTGYSAPTTLGNARITDAQRARAEGRSPIIAPGMQPAALTAGLGLLLAGGAAIGPYALLVPLVLLQALTAAGWFRLNGMWPARQGIALAFAGGLVADAALLAAGREHGPAALLGTLGVWVLLTVVLQLRSHAGADERMYGLMATVVSAALAVLAAGHLAAAGDAVAVGGVAVAAAVLARALPLPGAASVVVALLAGAGAGVAVGGFTDYGSQGALLGLAAGVAALIGLRVASYDYPSRFVHMTAGVALPLTAAAPAVYLIGRALV
ncbi:MULTISPECIES: hypothetical protein [unclassified Streptomyces]|uniref:hypothetical protein n=1 Tax=unclassified Streptomyces TaxID=2593676 RepID=UPI00081F5B90|nr:MULTISPECIES: hypothetical protein [unclassified Streptomyces]MYR95391.1 hypothetical protein [Streptomyces sp. SID4937]SCD89333.1 hypothetical protein GA0115243_104564 [Streptomyces sp. ScaeMP-e83]